MLRTVVSKPPESPPPRVAATVLGLLIAAFAIMPPALPADSGESLDDVLDALDERFDVYRLADGYAVRVPLPEMPERDSEGRGSEGRGPEGRAHGDPGALLEVRDGRIFRAGEPMTDESLDAWIGAESRRQLRALATWTGEASQPELTPEAPAPRRSAPPPDASTRSPAPSDRRMTPGRERAQRRHVEERGSAARFWGDVHIEKYESAKEAIALRGDVIVDGTVRKDVIALGGDVSIDGEVGGHVTAVGGTVRLGSRARVEGDVVAVGGAVRRQSGARVDGRVREIRPGRAFSELVPRVPRFDVRWPRPTQDGVFDRFSNAMLLIAITVLLSVLVAAPMRELQARLGRAPLRAGGVGVAVQLAILPLVVVLALVLVLTIVGIPVLVLLLPTLALVLCLMSIVGYAAVASVCGRRVGRVFGRRDDGPFIVAVLGVMAIQGWSLAGEMIDGWFGPFGLAGDLLLAIGWVVRYAAWTLGIGVVVMALIGWHQRRGQRAPAISGRT